MKNILTLSLAGARLWFETHLLPRYQQLEVREQRIVLLASVLLPLMFIVFGLILPLQERQDHLRADLKKVQAQVAEAERLALYLTEHAVELKASGGAAENLLSRVERLARQTKVRAFMTRIKPQFSPDSGSQRLMVTIKDVPYDAILRFIHTLAEQNLDLDGIKLQATKSPGRVHLRAMISGS